MIPIVAAALGGQSSGWLRVCLPLGLLLEQAWIAHHHGEATPSLPPDPQGCLKVSVSPAMARYVTRAAARKARSGLASGMTLTTLNALLPGFEATLAGSLSSATQSTAT